MNCLIAKGKPAFDGTTTRLNKKAFRCPAMSGFAFGNSESAMSAAEVLLIQDLRI